MKTLITAFAFAVSTFGAFAADVAPPAPAPSLAAPAPSAAASKPLSAQQSKLGDCATANKGKKGDDYKNGVKACLAEQKSAKQKQQQKMGDCAKANKGKKGDDYKNGVKACLAA